MKKLLHLIGYKSSLFFVFGLIFTFILSMIELGISVFIQTFLSALGISNEKVEFFGKEIPKFELNYVVLFLVIIGIFRFIFQILNSQSAMYATAIINTRFRSICLYDLFSKKLTNKKEISNIYFNLNEIFPKTSAFINFLYFLTTQLIQIISLIFLMFISLWKETLVGLIGTFLIASIIIILNKKMKIISKLIPNEYNKFTATLERVFKNITFLKIMRNRDPEFKKAIENILNYESKSLKVTYLNILSANLAPFLGIILLIIIISLSQNVWGSSSLKLIAFLYLFIRFIQALSSASHLIGSVNIVSSQYKIALDYFHSFSDQNVPILFKEVNKLNLLGSNNKQVISSTFFENNQREIDKKLETITPSIQFKDVTFFYNDKQISILNNFSAEIEPGKQIGIVGESGAGKTTLLMLLFGLLEPKNGSILINSFDPQYYFDNPANRVGYVGVEPYLIKGTIKENLLYSIKHHVNEEEIWQALSLVKMNNFVQKAGLDYIINEDQSGLSAGQKQRICIARAILNKPSLLILDEATANLDEITESEVALAIESLKEKCTVIIVSHRKGIIKNADTILELKPVHQ